MITPARLFFLFLGISFISCSYTPNELKIAEQIIEKHPDSALHILQKLPSEKYSSDANKALYGILLFQALDKNYMPLQPDSLIDFAIAYYQKRKDEKQLAIAFFYNGRKFYYKNNYQKATYEYLKAIDIIKTKKDYNTLGKICSDMGYICSFQGQFKEARKKHMLAKKYFELAKKKLSAEYSQLDISVTYRCTKDTKIALKLCQKIISQTNDSILLGIAYQEIGVNYMLLNQLDSAILYLKVCLAFPAKGASSAIRNCSLADAYTKKNEYDSAIIYASESLKHPSRHSTIRECYRILTNAAYLNSNIKLMNKYMSKYQEYTDSVRIIESQTKAIVIEQQHNSKAEVSSAKQNLTIYTLLLIASILIIVIIGAYIYHRNRLRKLEIDNYKLELNNKQIFVSQSISTKIEELKSIQTKTRKNTHPGERVKLNKELYNNALHIDNWDVFSSDMNHAFNNIVDRLQIEHPALSRKEISWCCLHLLDISNVDKVLLLETTTEGLYKLKQRIAQKLNLVSTKELDIYLRNKAANRN